MTLSLQKFYHILIMGGDCICLLIIVRGLYYGTGTSIVILLAESIWWKSLHDFNIKNICRITTLICFKDI